MNNMRYLTVICLITGLSLLTVSCGDDPASANEDPPEFPTFENMQPDLSYFDANIEAGSPAASASFYASLFTVYSQMGAANSMYFSEADRDDADYSNGTWTWEYNYEYGGESVSIQLISEERPSETYWSMSWSYNGRDGSIENYKIMEGTVAHDNKSGSWTFNSINDETGEHYPSLKTNWSWISETEGEIKTDFYTDGVVSESYIYEQNGTEFQISLTTQDEDSDILIYWNEETGNGYYQEGSVSNRVCWDSSYEEIACG